ncbi:tetratricopeptide repeat protein [Nioella aestuarii]|uniref:tetratricopeptide repeat protein n=1 Tax=Nioella aestuarii TaxID=1662864 RepID=UPI003D7FA6C4
MICHDDTSSFRALLIAAATAAQADDAELCRLGATPLDERVAACERLLDTAEDRVSALVSVGRAYEANQAYEQALGWYDQALALAPESETALGRRSVTYGHLERWDAAEADLRRLIGVRPDSTWGHYRLGFVLSQSGRNEEAVEALERSVSLGPNYFFAWELLGRVQEELGNPEAAGWAYREAARDDPFYAYGHLRAFRTFRDAGLLEEAAYHARIIYTLDPNETILESWLHEYAASFEQHDLPPLHWSPPPENREIRYFAIRAHVDDRDEMEAAIGDLIGWFTGTSRPRPFAAALVRVSQTVVDDQNLFPDAVIEDELVQMEDNGRPAPRYRGLFPFAALPFGPDGPLVEPRFDTGAPSDAWPLVAGNHAEGSGRFVVDCSLGRGFQYSVLGCVPGVDLAELGEFAFNIDVSSELIHVPLGLFQTYRVDIDMEARATILGVTNELPYQAIFWIDPGLNTWIARRLTVGDEYVYNLAMDVIEPD